MNRSFGPRQSVGGKMAKGSMSQSRSYSFPVMNIPDLVACLQDLLGTQALDADTISKPKFQALRPVFDGLLEVCYGIEKEQIEQPPFESLADMASISDHEELHEDSVPFMHFFNRLSKLVHAAGVIDFTILDLIRPSPPRICLVFSALVNFAKFREENAAKWEDLASSIEESKERLHMSRGKAEDLERQLTDERAERERQAPEIESLKRDCRAIEEEVGQLNREQAVLRHESGEIKARISHLKEELGSVDSQLENGKNRMETLEGQVVSSPGRLRKELAELDRGLRENRETQDDLQRQKIDVEARLEQIARAFKDVGKANKALGSVRGKAEEYKAAVKNVKSMKAQLEELASEGAAMSAQEQFLLTSLARTQEKWKEFGPSAQQRKEEAEQALQASNQELENIQRRTEMLRQKHREAIGKRQQLEKQREGQRHAHDAECKEMHQSFSHLKSTVSNYHGRLLRNITNQ